MDSEVEKAIKEASRLCDEECDEEAEGILRIAIEKHPKNLALQTMLGIILSRLHKDEESEATLRKVLSIAPLHEDAACALSRLLDQSLRTNEAEDILRAQIEGLAESHAAVDDLCRLLIAEERYIEAVQIARNHATIFPNTLEAYDGLRFTLAFREDGISEGYISAATSDEDVKQLLENLLEQYDVSQKIEENVIPQSSLEESTLNDLRDENRRVLNELGHLKRIIERRKSKIPSSLGTRLESALKEESVDR